MFSLTDRDNLPVISHGLISMGCNNVPLRLIQNPVWWAWQIRWGVCLSLVLVAVGFVLALLGLTGADQSELFDPPAISQKSSSLSILLMVLILTLCQILVSAVPAALRRQPLVLNSRRLLLPSDPTQITFMVLYWLALLALSVGSKLDFSKTVGGLAIHEWAMGAGVIFLIAVMAFWARPMPFPLSPSYRPNIGYGKDCEPRTEGSHNFLAAELLSNLRQTFHMDGILNAQDLLPTHDDKFAIFKAITTLERAVKAGVPSARTLALRELTNDRSELFQNLLIAGPGPWLDTPIKSLLFTVSEQVNEFEHEEEEIGMYLKFLASDQFGRDLRLPRFGVLACHYQFTPAASHLGLPFPIYNQLHDSVNRLANFAAWTESFSNSHNPVVVDAVRVVAAHHPEMEVRELANKALTKMKYSGWIGFFSMLFGKWDNTGTERSHQ